MSTPDPAEALEAAFAAYLAASVRVSLGADRASDDAVAKLADTLRRWRGDRILAGLTAAAPILLAAGRTAAAADIRAAVDRRGRLVEEFPPVTDEAIRRNEAVLGAYAEAARIAEGKTDA